MIYFAKVGTEDMYIRFVDMSINSLLDQVKEECSVHENVKLLEIKKADGTKINIDKYVRRLEKNENVNKFGYQYKDSVWYSYRSIQQQLWYHYVKKLNNIEKYNDIKIELKEIRNKSNNLEEFKKYIEEYFETLEIQEI